MKMNGRSDDNDPAGTLYWNTDLAGLFRIQAQLVNEGTSKYIAYSFCYLILVFMTLFFGFTYLKRVVYMAFLTIVAPLVAMTYPIDKMKDRKSTSMEYVV